MRSIARRCSRRLPPPGGPATLSLRFSWAFPLHPARTSKGAEEALEVGSRNLRSPGACMGMSMQPATRTAAAGGYTAVLHWLQRVLAGPPWFTPRTIAFVAAGRRPVRHCRWQRVVVQGCELSIAKDNAAAHHRQVRSQESNLVFR